MYFLPKKWFNYYIQFGIHFESGQVVTKQFIKELFHVQSLLLDLFIYDNNSLAYWCKHVIQHEKISVNALPPSLQNYCRINSPTSTNIFHIPTIFIDFIGSQVYYSDLEEDWDKEDQAFGSVTK